MTKKLGPIVAMTVALVACGGGGSGATPPSGPPAGTTPAPTPTPTTSASYLNSQATISRYMGTVDPTVTNAEGCQMAQGVGDQAASGLVVLDYGEPYTDGVSLGTSDYGVGNPFVTDAQIQAAAQGYLDGYARCNEPAANHLILAIGTSNFGSHVTAAHAVAWAQMIAQLDAYVASKAYPNETVAAANDMETGWGSPTVTRAWLDAYVAQTNTIPIYDYGDAGGCSQTSYSATAICGSVGWTQADVGYVGGGAGPNVRALPEIYNTSGATAKQWSQIAVGMATAGTPLTFAAVMTQVGSCGSGCAGLDNTPAQALSLLNGQLALYPQTQSTVVTMSTDVTTAN
ncbi:MAG TPA: hypothetical protein VIJ12_06775 [Candidatus Baltobacteraceae bacterium]